MNRDFKLRFDEIKDNDPGNRDIKPSSYETFESNGHVRNLCFVWPDGKMKFLNYAYLISGEYLPDENTVILLYTTDTVTLKGFSLNDLFEELITHLPKRIICSDIRYDSISQNKAIITSILIT